ncbi:MAG: TolC family outer membrane protein [Chlorobium sp.]
MSRSIMKLLVCVTVLVVIAVASPLHAAQLDLMTAYQKAVEYDARLRSAKADNLIYKEEIGKARSQFRPNVRMNAARGRSVTQHGYLGSFSAPDYYNTINYGVSVRQPLINFSNIASYKQAKVVSAKSDVDLEKEESSLMARTAEAYCNALYAEDNLAFSKVLITATLEQLRQARQRFDKGFGTVTEVEEAQAGYDNAKAEGVDIMNSVEFSRQELENLTGVYPDQLCSLVSERLALLRPQPNNVESWIELAHSANPEVVGARQEIVIAKREIEKQRAARYPTIDLVGGRNYSESENNYSIGSIYDTYSISLQVSMPVYTGGYISASVRQARAKWLKAGEQLNWQERGVESEIRKFYNGVISGIEQVKAYEQAVHSHELALIGTQKGYDAGLRSNVDVLDAQQKLYASRRNLAKARYQYILNRLMLKQTAGILSAADIDEVNGWLVGMKP